MYLPKVFTENDCAAAISLMNEYPFATIFASGGELEASQAPTIVEEVDETVSIQFHLARANPQCKLLTEGAACLVVYTGPNCYVSPSWYEEHPNVPTWNYLTVHATGTISIQSPAELEAQLAVLTAHHEPKAGGDWKVDHMAEDFKADLLRQICGFRVTVMRLHSKSKLSQNRTPQDRQNVTMQLMQSNDPSPQSVGRRMAAKFDE